MNRTFLPLWWECFSFDFLLPCFCSYLNRFFPCIFGFCSNFILPLSIRVSFHFIQNNPMSSFSIFIILLSSHFVFVCLFTFTKTKIDLLKVEAYSHVFICFRQFFLLLLLLLLNVSFINFIHTWLLKYFHFCLYLFC